MTMDYDTREVRAWPLLLVLGLVNLVIGICLLVWPDVTLTVAVFLLGLQLLVFGIFRIVLAIGGRQYGNTWLLVLIGLLGVIVGLLVMREPFRSLEVVVALVGIFAVVVGIAGLIQSWTGPVETRPHTFLDGVVPLAFGLILLAWPDITVRVFAIITGAFLVVWSVVVLFAAYAAWRSEPKVEAPA